MSKLKAQGNASGTGVFTLQTPPTNTDRTISLPDSTGTLVDTTGATFTGGVTGTDVTLSGGLYVGGTGSANYLDDYEEGTWTPTLLFGGSESGHTYDTQTGVYTKIGNKVFCDFHLSITAKGGTSGLVAIGGFPFTVENAHIYTSLDGGTINFGYYAGTSGIHGLTGRAIGGNNQAHLYRRGASDGNMNGSLGNTEVTNSFSVRADFVFQTTS